MNTFLLASIAVALLVIAAFLVTALMEVRRTLVRLRKTMDTRLDPALEELELTLKGLRDITDNVNEVAADVQQFSGSLRSAGQTLKAVNELISGLGATTAVKAVSLKAGVGAAVGYFLTHLIRKGDGK